MTAIRALTPKPASCSGCTVPFVGIKCPLCETVRGAYVAMKAETARRRAAQPVGKLPMCLEYPRSLCNCGQRRTCLGAA